MVAIRNGFILAANIGCSSFTVEYDSSNVIEAVNQEAYIGSEVAVIMECKELGSEFVKDDVIHCFQEANGVADCIAKHSLCSIALEFWDSSIPDFISHFIINDLSII